MADQQLSEGPSTSNVSGASSESTVELNIKTLDSQTYTFQVDKNIQVSALKDKIASQIGVLVEQQRLIFRGKVLKDDHLLSEYHVENGDTLHLVLRQSQSSSGVSTGEATNTGQEPQPTAGASRNRVGQISHSVVLGTFNVGDQGEGLVPDLNRVIGAVLNSIGIGNMTGGQIPGVQVGAPTPASQGNNSQSQTGNQESGQTFPGQSLPQVGQIPLGAAIALPSINTPIPDSLHTLIDFMNRMELVFSQNGYLPNQSPSTAADPAAVELPTTSRGLSTPEALSTVLRHAERLFGGHAVAALSHIARRLEQEGSSSDPTVRGQVQTESVQIGLAMQHLGALLLELGRTILTLRMGQSPAESSVNAGPAVYISPLGPNPIMVQPFPLQTSSLFGGSTAIPSNPGALGALGIGSVPRNVNIHIHAVGARAINGDGMLGERSTGTDSGQSRVLPVRNIIGTAVPSGSTVISDARTPQPGQSESSAVRDQFAVSGVENDSRNTPLGVSSASRVNQGQSSQMSNSEDTLMNSKEKPSHRLAGGSDSLLSKPEGSASAGARRSGQGLGSPDESSSIPLGLGLGGLQPKRGTKQSKPHGKSTDDSTSNNQNGLSKRDGQQVLQSLASLASRRNDIAVPSGTQSGRGGMETIGTGNQNVDGQSEMANAMSHVLQSPALNGLLGGLSQQSGVGSPDVLRNMLQQVTQNPAMMNTVSQFAQQIDPQDLGGMFAGQGGGMDLSRMFQQMMPLVSQAFGGASMPQQNPNVAQRPGENASRSVVTPTTENFQINLDDVTQRIENNSPPAEVFRSLVEHTSYVHQHGSDDQTLVDELCSAEGLANEFMEMLRDDVSRRLQDKRSE